MKSKSGPRTKVINSIISTLKSPEIYNTINYRKQSEDKIKQFMYPYLLNKIAKLYEDQDKVSPKTAKKKAKEGLLWEGNVKTTVSNKLFLGAQHRPDFVVEYKDLTIAIEIKRGDNGSSLREGIGQSQVYSTHFDFTICLFIDTSKEKKILNASTSDEEKKFINRMWRNSNIKFIVV